MKDRYMKVINKDNPLPFKEYKKIVESVRANGLRIELDDIGKYKGDFVMEYKYTIRTEDLVDGKIINYPCFPPLKVIKETPNIFDNRYQLTKEELEDWLNSINRV